MIAVMQLRSNISFKSCGYRVAEVVPSSCGVAVAGMKKNLRVAISAKTPLKLYRRLAHRRIMSFCEYLRDFFYRIRTKISGSPRSL